MRAAIFAVPLVAGILASSLAAAKPASRPSANEVAMRATLDSLNAICARRDSLAFDSLFDSEEPVLFVGSSEGEEFHGRGGVARFRRFLFAMPFTFSFDLAQVTLRCNGEWGWAYVNGQMLHRAADGRGNARPYRYLVAMAKRGGAWKWQVFDGSVPGAD